MFIHTTAPAYKTTQNLQSHTSTAFGTAPTATTPDSYQKTTQTVSDDSFRDYVRNAMLEINSDWFVFDKQGNIARTVSKALNEQDWGKSPFAKELKEWIAQTPALTFDMFASKLVVMLADSKYN